MPLLTRFRMTVFSRPSSITLESFSSTLSVHHDSSNRDIILDTVPTTAQTPSPLEYHVVISRIAYIIHTHVRHVKTSPVSIHEALQQLDQISQNLPPHLQTSTNARLPPHKEDFDWVLSQRSQLSNLLEVCRIDLCFSCLPRLLE